MGAPPGSPNDHLREWSHHQVALYTRNCRACHAPILRPDGGAAVYDPQGDRPLPAPSRGAHLQGHSAEPIMP